MPIPRLVPKRKSLPEDTTQPEVVSASSPIDYSKIVKQTLDEILDGDLYARAKQEALSSGLVLLDEIVEGTYAKTLATHLDAGKIKLSSLTTYTTGYDPSTKRRVFTVTPTTPYDVGDLWLDATTVKRCTTARATGAYVAGDWTATTLDAIADGTSYGRIDITDIQAGHILLSTTVKDGLWYSESGVDIDATKGIRLYGTDIAFGTFANVTDARAGTNWKTKMDSTGQLLAGSGALILNELGLKVKGAFLIFQDSDGVLRGYVKGMTDGYLWVSSEDALVLDSPNVVYVDAPQLSPASASTDIGSVTTWWDTAYVLNYKAFTSCTPYSHESGYCGYSDLAWLQGVFKNLYSDDGSVSAYQHHDDIALLKAIKSRQDRSGKDVLDAGTLPPELFIENKSGQKYVNLPGLHGLSLGIMKQIVDRLETLEKVVNNA